MSQSVFSDVGRILAIGDLHGNYPGFKRILHEAGILDDHGHWRARDTHLVQLGDILGRGGEPGKIFKLLKRLEAEAPEFGSRVHVLLGNHEAMCMSGLILYNTMEEFQDLAGEEWLESADTPKSGRDGSAVVAIAAEAAGAEAAEREAAETETMAAAANVREQAGHGRGRLGAALDPKLGKRLDMLGCREFRAAMSPLGKVGSWLLGHDSAVSINKNLFVHGGLNRAHGCMPLQQLNERVRAELSDDGLPDAGEDVMLRRDGPQWNRDFTLRRNAAREAELGEVLDYHGCSRMVVGHTPTSCIDPSRAGRIVPLYGDRLYCIDTGIGKTYGSKLSALNVERGAASALYF
jgi:calcineurin-like phosphoesterase family protein